MKEFRAVLKEWMGEMEFMAPDRCPDGTPRMGKHETEELFRAGKKLLAEPIQGEPIIVEKLKRVGAVEVRERIYGTAEVTAVSVLQDWTQKISTRQQGVLIIALRGPDGVRKEDPAKPIVRTLRGMVMNAGRTGGPVGDEVWTDDPFMTMQWIKDEYKWTGATKNFFDQWDAYNVHFLQHLAHAYAVAGIHYIDDPIRRRAWKFYERCCRKLHMNPETPGNVVHRLRDGIREEDGKAD